MTPPKQKRLPVLFIGHGSPMNALAQNEYTQNLARLAARIPRPDAILCISAHWMTKGTRVTHMAHPKTIHDFRGFPQALLDVQYPAPGKPALAERILKLAATIQADDTEWGLDHGTWSVLRHLYPAADIPVVQLSLNLPAAPQVHFDLGRALRPLRDENVLIIGSGNIVHNLRQIQWESAATPHPLAVEFDEWVKARLLDGDDHALVNQALESGAGRFSIPTPDHWYPFLYVLGARDEHDELRFEHEEIQNASISMRSFSFTPRG